MYTCAMGSQDSTTSPTPVRRRRARRRSARETPGPAGTVPAASGVPDVDDAGAGLIGKGSDGEPGGGGCSQADMIAGSAEDALLLSLELSLAEYALVPELAELSQLADLLVHRRFALLRGSVVRLTVLRLFVLRLRFGGFLLVLGRPASGLPAG